jgi:hypothetical protein
MQTYTGAEPTRATFCSAFPASHEEGREGREAKTPFSAMHASRSGTAREAHVASAERTWEQAGSIVWHVAREPHARG